MGSQLCFPFCKIKVHFEGRKISGYRSCSEEYDDIAEGYSVRRGGGAVGCFPEWQKRNGCLRGIIRKWAILLGCKETAKLAKKRGQVRELTDTYRECI
jgi:hypothetical protein